MDSAMADETRPETFDENIRQMQQISSSMAKRQDAFHDSLKRLQTERDQTFEEIMGMLRFLLRKKEERTILIKIKYEIYPISTEVLDKVFSTCGILESVVKLSPEEEFHSEICFQRKEAAIKALELYNGRCVYDRCCELELFQASQVRDRSSPVEVPIQEEEDVSEISTTLEISKSQSQFEEIPSEDDDTQIAQDSPTFFDQKFEVLSDLGDSEAELVDDEQQTLAPNPAGVDKDRDSAEFQTRFESSKVIPNPSRISKIEAAFHKEMVADDEYFAILVSSEKSTTEFKGNLMGFLKIPRAYYVFVEMPSRSIRVELVRNVIEGMDSSHPIIFDPGGGNRYVCLSAFQETDCRNEEIGLIFDEYLECSNLGSCENVGATFGIGLGQFLITWPYDKVKNFAINPGEGHRDFLSIKMVSFGAESSPVIAAVCKEIGGMIGHQQGSGVAIPFDSGKRILVNDCCPNPASYDHPNCNSVVHISKSDLRFTRNSQRTLPFDRGKEAFFACLIVFDDLIASNPYDRWKPVIETIVDLFRLLVFGAGNSLNIGNCSCWSI